MLSMTTSGAISRGKVGTVTASGFNVCAPVEELNYVLKQMVC